MSSDKIDPLLFQEMQRLERAGRPAQSIVVLIELESTGAVPASNLQAFEETVRRGQRGVRKKLDEMGAGKTVRPLVLANALEAELTGPQIASIAALPEVKRISWNRAERVTA